MHKKEPQTGPEPEPEQFSPSANSVRTNLVFLKTVDFTGKIYTDQIGWFPITSSKGNKYILVDYHQDSNNIHAEPFKTQTGVELKSAYHKIHNLLDDKCLQPSLHILYNECPNVIKTFMREVNEIFQLVPPHVHRINLVERDIQAFKRFRMYVV